MRKFSFAQKLDRKYPKLTCFPYSWNFLKNSFIRYFRYFAWSSWLISTSQWNSRLFWKNSRLTQNWTKNTQNWPVFDYCVISRDWFIRFFWYFAWGWWLISTSQWNSRLFWKNSRLTQNWTENTQNWPVFVNFLEIGSLYFFDILHEVQGWLLVQNGIVGLFRKILIFQKLWPNIPKIDRFSILA